MKNNDILRSIRYTFDFNDSKMIELFALASHTVTRSEISNWLKKDDDPYFQDIYDQHLSIFLNGLISYKRGKKEGEPPKAEKKLNNNIVFKKLRIALNLRDDDILEILALVDMELSKHELSAFFRKPGQNQYRACKDQVLRYFLQGMRIKYRDYGLV